MKKENYNIIFVNFFKIEWNNNLELQTVIYNFHELNGMVYLQCFIKIIHNYINHSIKDNLEFIF